MLGFFLVPGWYPELRPGKWAQRFIIPASMRAERIFMATVEISNISKSFGNVRAVDDVSFNVEKGEMFGLLGPNGAGKTTTIRIMLDVFKADSGNVTILGGPMTEAKKNRVGYMPEERGLYQDVPLERCLLYLSSLKGLEASAARIRMEAYLDQFDLTAHRRKKVKELSKGMQQKAQIIATLIHEPELIIIDEPFSGLDPVNTRLVKDLLLKVNQQGTTIIMSTHQMHQVEELCDRILLIHHGRNMLYGNLGDIQRKFSGHAVLVRTLEPLPELPGVIAIEAHNSAQKLQLDEKIQPQEILQGLVSKGITVEQFEVALPTLDEIFIQVVQEQEEVKA
jgi:ABC-2 type transport system ATP-binding protein